MPSTSTRSLTSCFISGIQHEMAEEFSGLAPGTHQARCLLMRTNLSSVYSALNLNTGDQGKHDPSEFVTLGSPIPGLPFAKEEAISIDIPGTLAVEVLRSELPTPSSASKTTWWQADNANGGSQARLEPKAIED